MQMKRATVFAALSLNIFPGALAVDRQLLQTPAPAPVARISSAPAPAGAKQAANGVFTFEAASVTFVNATTMILSGVPNSTAYVQYHPRVNAGTFAKDVFFSPQLADTGSGKWLGGPQVLLQGTLKGNITNIVVTMNAPVYNPETEDVVTSYMVFNGTAAALPATKGVVNSVLSTVASSSTGSNVPAVLTILPAQSKMVNVTVFVDITNIAQYTQKRAGEKASLIRLNQEFLYSTSGPSICCK